MYSLIDIFLVYLLLINQHMLVVNDFSSSYMLARMLDRKSIEVKNNINPIDATTELYSTAKKVVFLHTNMNMKKITSAF